MRRSLFETLRSIDSSFAGFHHCRFLFAYNPFPQMVEAHVRHNPIQPGVEAAIETKCVQIPKYLEKDLLIHIPRLLGGAQQVHGLPEHTLIVDADQLLERVLVATLRRPDERIHLRAQASASRTGCVLGHLPVEYDVSVEQW